MFWLNTKKINFQLRTLIKRHARSYSQSLVLHPMDDPQKNSTLVVPMIYEKLFEIFETSLSLSLSRSSQKGRSLSSISPGKSNSHLMSINNGCL